MMHTLVEVVLQGEAEWIGGGGEIYIVELDPKLYLRNLVRNMIMIYKVSCSVTTVTIYSPSDKDFMTRCCLEFPKGKWL